MKHHAIPKTCNFHYLQGNGPIGKSHEDGITDADFEVLAQTSEELKSKGFDAFSWEESMGGGVQSLECSYDSCLKYGEPPYRPQNTVIVLHIGTPEEVPLILRNPLVSSGQGLRA